MADPAPRAHASATAFFRRVHDLLTATSASDADGRLLTVDAATDAAVDLLRAVAERGGHVLLVGNGGSAAIAAHLELDLCNRAGIPARCFQSAPALTALANDHGYETAYERLVTTHARRGDLLVAVSSSGRSENILRAVSAAVDAGCSVLTLSGFDDDNPLRRRGDLNFHVASTHYGEVEVAHEMLAHYLADRCVECARHDHAAGNGQAAPPTVRINPQAVSNPRPVKTPS